MVLYFAWFSLQYGQSFGELASPPLPLTHFNISFVSYFDLNFFSFCISETCIPDIHSLLSRKILICAWIYGAHCKPPRSRELFHQSFQNFVIGDYERCLAETAVAFVPFAAGRSHTLTLCIKEWPQNCGGCATLQGCSS